MVLGIFQKAFSQVTISQLSNFPSSNFPKVRLDLLRRHRLQWGQSAAARTDLGNRKVGKFTLGDTPSGRWRLGKSLWEGT